jgi:acyl-coenzyme A thioesterase PaaI-like protein
VYKGTGLMCGVVRWAGYCVRAGNSVQEYRVNVWSCTVGRILCEGRSTVEP